MKIINALVSPAVSSQSTLLVSQDYFYRFLASRSIKGKKLTKYLHRLLQDPDLDVKLKNLKSKKWKKTYQAENQDLRKVFFYPDEADWAHLSLISYSTGYSRCYIFVYLMLLEVGILKIPGNNRTVIKNPRIFAGTKLLSTIILNRTQQILTRIMQT